jgi:hypothetical protein
MLTTASPASKIVVTGLLRYARWEMTSSGTATFMIAGIARANC